MRKRFGGYVRVSRVGGRVFLRSPEDQEAEILRWGEREGHEIVMLEWELDRSGGDDDRPILLDGIRQIEDGDLDGIAVWNFKRFTRGGLKSSIHFLELIEDAGGQLESMSEPIDTSTPQGRKMRSMFFLDAQEELEIQSAGFERAKANAVAEGIWSAPKVPLGYLKNEDRLLEEDPETAPLVRKGFAMRADGDSYQTIADMIAEALGRPYSWQNVRNMLKSRVYLGEAKNGKYKNPNAHPALVEEADWQSAQLDLPVPARGVNGKALLAGVIRCAACRKVMSLSTSKMSRGYRCRKHGSGGDCPEPAGINAKTIEPIVERLLLDHLDGVAVQGKERGAALAEAERGVVDAQTRLDSFLDNTQDFDNPAFTRKAADLSEAVKVAERALGEARRLLPDVPAPGTARKWWAKLDADERNHVLRGAFDVVWVQRGSEDFRVIAAGFAPDDLPNRGRAYVPRSVDLSADLPGEIRTAALQHAA